MISVRNLVKEYSTRAGTLRILDGVSLDVNLGHAAVVMGPSGSGKSTLLHILGTLDEPTSGEVVLGDANPFRLGAVDRANFRNQQIGFVFQDHQLMPQCSVLENVLVPLLARSRSTQENAHYTDRARMLLDTVGLSLRLQHRPAELSGGEKQRAAIARALLLEPTILLCDEPTGNLDQASGNAVGDCLTEILGDNGPAMVLVTHNSAFANRFEQIFTVQNGILIQ
ncbi:TPA: ATP-binding protein [Candidatus Sumerlaeota bacterium]|nr:ATP-binding protein [Candidatus Sumerlaeota bacterium]